MRLLTAVAAGLLMTGFGVALAQPALPGAELLPEGAGRDTTLRVCTGCHEPEVIVNRTQNAAPWSDVVQGMVEKGAEATPEEAAQIAAYLKKALPETPA